MACFKEVTVGVMAIETYKHDFFEDEIAEREVMIDCEGVCQELQDFTWQNCRGIIKLEVGPERVVRFGIAGLVEVIASG